MKTNCEAGGRLDSGY